jgi:hypothetical protein
MACLAVLCLVYRIIGGSSVIYVKSLLIVISTLELPVIVVRILRLNQYFRVLSTCIGAAGILSTLTLQVLAQLQLSSCFATSSYL